VTFCRIAGRFALLRPNRIHLNQTNQSSQSGKPAARFQATFVLSGWNSQPAIRVTNTMRWILLLFTVMLAAAAAPPNVVFLEPVEKVDTRRAEVEKGSHRYRKVDGEKYRGWLDNVAARRALHLYAGAFAILEQAGNPQRQPRDYYVALVPGGNHAAVGFEIETKEGVEKHPRHAYILLDPNVHSFSDTILHETGHVAMSMMSGGLELPRADVASIPHSTAALVDRATAFSEGWAVHMETVAAHQAGDAGPRGLFFHERVVFGGGGPYPLDEYFRHAADLATYAQTFARYAEVRDNNYSFETAYRGGDYLRAQLEKARDFAQVRGPNQLLQSEGFHASLFFLYLMRGETRPPEDVIAARQAQMLKAMQKMFASVKPEEDTPWLLNWALEYMKLYPAEKDTLIDALNELSHGVFVDAGAAPLWRKHYLAALRLDLKTLDREGVLSVRKRWHEQVARDPGVLFSRLGPQVACEVKSIQVNLVAFGEPQPLLFDINTAAEAVLRLVPGISDEQVKKWMAGRPFRNLEALKKAIGPSGCAR
jgi:hypothetical protein